MAETFHDEIITLNFPFGILCPKPDVRVPIVIVEDIGVIEVLIQMQVLIQFAQGDDGIAVGVVECVIEVDEKVGVLQFSTFNFQFLKMALKHLSAAQQAELDTIYFNRFPDYPAPQPITHEVHHLKDIMSIL